MCTEAIWKDVTSPDYFRGAMENMVTAGLGRKEDVSLRFGKTGAGIQPNYQIEGLDGRVIRFHGGSHKLYHERPFESSEPENLTPKQFKWPEIQELLKKCWRQQRVIDKWQVRNRFQFLA